MQTVECNGLIGITGAAGRDCVMARLTDSTEVWWPERIVVTDRRVRAAVGEHLVASGHDVCVTAYVVDDVCGDTDQVPTFASA